MCSLYRQKPLRVRIIHSVYLRKQGASERHSLLAKYTALAGQKCNASVSQAEESRRSTECSEAGTERSVRERSGHFAGLPHFYIFTFSLHFCSLAP